jgi:hypothetical protein
LIIMAALVAAAVQAGPVVAQTSPDVMQLTPAILSAEVESPAPQHSSEAAPQISGNADSSPAEAQLTNKHASRQAPKQLSTDPRDAKGAPAISKPSDGRTAAVELVEGDDRCDPAVPAARQPEACKKVIETRADDYTRPSPTELSPEQKLLIDQQLREETEGVTEAAQKLAKSGEADDSTESMGIAAIVLRQSAPPPEEPDKQKDPTADAAAQAVIQAITQLPPQN